MDKFYNNRVLTKFMLIQPLIDIITSLMINEYSLSISLGMIFRFLFLIYATIYILKNRDDKIKAYALIWVVYIFISFIGNIILNDGFSLTSYISHIAKLIYFPIILLFFIIYFKNNKNIDRFTFIIIALMVGISLFSSVITNTAYCSYSSSENCYRKGIVSWFNSANEYGLILISLLGYSLIDFIKNKNIYNITASLFTIVFLCILGTKASYVGCVGVLSISLIFYIIYNKFIKKNKFDFKSVFFIGGILLSVLIFTIKLPIYTNLLGSYERAVNESGQAKCETCCPKFDKSAEEIKSEISNALVFNGRNDFLVVNKEMYNNSSIFSKLYGLISDDKYYQGIYYDHIVERDFHDLLYQYGFIGFLVELLLPIYLVINVIVKFVKTKKIIIDEEIFILGLTSAFILLGSYLAGHFLFAPAVSIYVTYSISIIYKRVMYS